MENKKTIRDLSLKWYALLPASAIFLLVLAFIFVLVKGDHFGDVALAFVIIGLLIIMSVLVVSMVGALRNSRAMFLIGASITLWCANGALGYVMVMSLNIYGNITLLSLNIGFYVMISVVSFALGIAGLIFATAKNKNYGTTFLFVTALLSEIFLVGFLVSTSISNGLSGLDGLISTSYILLILAVIIIVGMILFISLTDKQTAQTAKPAATSHLIKGDDEDAKIAKIKRYRELLDEGILTQEEFDKKKQDILNS